VLAYAQYKEDVFKIKWHLISKTRR